LKYVLSAVLFLAAACGPDLVPCPTPDMAQPTPPSTEDMAVPPAPCPDLATPPPPPCDMAHPAPDMAKPPCQHTGCPHHHDDGDCHTHHCHWGW
jgi:hypothetical protein